MAVKKSTKTTAHKQAVSAKTRKVVQSAAPVTKHTKGFMDFIREQGVVGLAVGLAIGTSATVLVKSIVDNMINPIVGLILPGSSDLNSKYICLEKVGTECVNKLSYGAVISNLISFLAVALVIYFVVMGLKLDKLDKKKES